MSTDSNKKMFVRQSKKLPKQLHIDELAQQLQLFAPFWTLQQLNVYAQTHFHHINILTISMKKLSFDDLTTLYAKLSTIIQQKEGKVKDQVSRQNLSTNNLPSIQKEFFQKLFLYNMHLNRRKKILGKDAVKLARLTLIFQMTNFATAGASLIEKSPLIGGLGLILLWITFAKQEAQVPKKQQQRKKKKNRWSFCISLPVAGSD